MPYLNLPKRLTEICSQKELENLNWIKTRDSLQNYINNFTYIVNSTHISQTLGFPFQLYTNVLSTLMHKGNVNKFNFEVLLYTSRKELHLQMINDWEYTDIESAVNLIIQKCHELQDLNLNGCLNLSEFILKNLISCLPNLFYLDLRDTVCNDDVVDIIWYNCAYLHILHLPRSSAITDRTLAKFNPHDFPACRRLSELTILNTNISEYGATNILRHLLFLQYLYYEKLILTLKLIVSKDLNYECQLQAMPVLHLNSLFMQEPIFIFTTCSNLTKLSLKLQTLNILPLNILSNLKLLKELSLEDYVITFHGSKDEFMKILKACGKNLEKLELTCYNQIIELSLLAQYCPSLKEFSFSSSGLALCNPNLNCLKGDWYSNLVRINIYKEFFSVLPEQEMNVKKIAQVLHFILKSSDNLKQLKIEWVKEFNDDFLELLIQTNSLSQIEELYLENSFLSVNAMFSLLKTTSPLRKIEFVQPFNLSLYDLDALNSYVKKENLKVEISYKNKITRTTLPPATYNF